MSVWDRIRRLLSQAREGAADVAQVANIKLDIRGLEGRREHLFREMGRKAFAAHGEGRGLPELAASCEEIAGIERQIRDKEKELEAVKARPPSGADSREEAAAG